jgi:hypothetical protein
LTRDNERGRHLRFVAAGAIDLLDDARLNGGLMPPSTPALPDVRKADAAYKPFPPFAEWSSGLKVDTTRRHYSVAEEHQRSRADNASGGGFGDAYVRR